ncbi:MAG: CHASE2 domain-containing protein, partial [Verrucomicrobiota bacterium]
MLRFFIKYSKWFIGAVGILIFALTQMPRVNDSIIWHRAEGALIDQRFLWRGYRTPDTNIVLVGVQTSSLSLDELAPEEIKASPTLELMTQPFPWSRAVFAATLDKLIAAGARTVVFDFVFASIKDGDAVFAAALKRHRGHVVIGSMIAGDEHKFTPPAPELLEGGGEDALGLVNIWSDPDEVVRRGKYRTSNERESPRLSKLAGSMFEDNLIHMSAQAVKQFQGHVSTPPYGKDNFIDFQGREKLFRTVPIEHLFVDTLWKAPPIDGGIIFSNKIVIVGPLAEIFHDTHNTPFGETPGPAIQGQMMVTLLHNSSLTEPTPLSNKALTLAMVVFALLLSLVVQNASLKPLLLILAAGA